MGCAKVNSEGSDCKLGTGMGAEIRNPLFKELTPSVSSSDWVLPERGTLTKPCSSNALNQELKVSLRGQGITDFTIYDLQCAASTLLHEQG